MSSKSELSTFSECSNDNIDIDVVYHCCIVLQSRSLVHNITSSGHLTTHFDCVIGKPFLREKSHNFQAL